MADQKHDKLRETEADENSLTGSQSSQTRRQFTRTGLVGSAVLMSLVNRPALATGGNECTASILASGNLSAHPDQVRCDFGCSPGYWKQGRKNDHHGIAWQDVAAQSGTVVRLDAKFSDAFSLVTGSNNDAYTNYLKSKTLIQVVNGEQLPSSLNSLSSVGLHAVAALANSYHSLISLTYVDPFVVRSAFQTAYNGYITCINGGDAPNMCKGHLNTFVVMYDLYGGTGGQTCPLGNDPWS